MKAAVHPFQEFVLKIHGRCNLACDYCYVYQSGDDGWRSRPRAMSDATVRQVARRIAEHAEEFALGRVWVVLHGGEPLLAGAATIDRICATVNKALPASTALSLGVQTNGTLLDDRFLDVFTRWNVMVGISLDGAGPDHDEHRRFHHGGGSTAHVSSALALLTRPATRHLFSGLLCTIDPSHDPIDTYRALLRHRPPVVDFLLPHGNWTRRPPYRADGSSETAYADWLIRIFDHWFDARQRPTGIRFFETLMGLLIGNEIPSEVLGLAPSRTLVVETDGSMEQTDSLKSAYPGAARLDLNVHDHSLRTALGHPAVVAGQGGLRTLAAGCRACPVVEICGAGLRAHRYRATNGFDNASVYCPDLWKVIHHVRARMVETLGKPP